MAIVKDGSSPEYTEETVVQTTEKLQQKLNQKIESLKSSELEYRVIDTMTDADKVKELLEQRHQERWFLTQDITVYMRGSIPTYLIVMARNKRS